MGSVWEVNKVKSFMHIKRVEIGENLDMYILGLPYANECTYPRPFTVSLVYIESCLTTTIASWGFSFSI